VFWRIILGITKASQNRSCPRTLSSFRGYAQITPFYNLRELGPLSIKSTEIENLMTSVTRSLPSKISALVSDVDGTLVTDDKVLTEGAQRAVADLNAAGILFAMISSRPPRGLRMLVEPLRITTPICGFNGGVIASPDLSVMSEHHLSPETARQAVDLLDTQDLQVWVFSRGDWLLHDQNGPYVGHEEHTIGFGPTPVGEFGKSLDAADKIVGVSANLKVLAQLERDVRAALGDHASVVRSQPYYLDITHPLANKGNALAELSKLLTVPLTEIAVIGDGSNDISMFEHSSLSIAMGNASPQVQRAADLVTGSNREDGFARAVQRIIIGGSRSSVKVEISRQGSGL
jgi:Cof subfamily protein (haloacid dehalogenase superfamily)